jgi:hypothetical protein
MAGRMDKRYFVAVNKTCTSNFKSQTRDYREKILSKLDQLGNGAPEVGKYNPKFSRIRK